MKILIGILILLFVLTTIGFSGIAYAQGASCAQTFEQVAYVDYEAEEAYQQQKSGHFLERREQYRDDRSWNEFSSERSENEFHYDNNF